MPTQQEIQELEFLNAILNSPEAMAARQAQSQGGWDGPAMSPATITAQRPQGLMALPEYATAAAQDAAQYGAIAPPRRLPPIEDATAALFNPQSFAQPALDNSYAGPLANAATIRDRTPMAAPQQAFRSGGGGSGGGGGYGQGPSPSAIDTLMGIGAALLGGGGLEGFIYRAGDISNFQQLDAERRAKLAQSLHKGSPAGSMQKQQQAIYASRMNSDVNRFIKAMSDGALSPDEREQGWQQLRANYAPLGLDPGPSPQELQWEIAQEDNPEFRKTQLVQQTKDEFGEAEASVVRGMFADGESTKSIAEYQLRLKEQQTKQLTAEAAVRTSAIKDTKKEIERDRARDLDRLENAGRTGEQFTYGSEGPATKGVLYEGAVDYVQKYHDERIRRVEEGLPAGPASLVQTPVVEGEEAFRPFVTELRTRAARNFKVDGTPFAGSTTSTDINAAPILPPTALPSDVQRLPPEVKARAINVDDPDRANEVIARANRDNVSILTRYKGVLRLVTPQR